MELEEMEKKRYSDFIKQNPQTTVVLGKQFFIGEFRYFVYTFLATNLTSIVALVFVTLAVR